MPLLFRKSVLAAAIETTIGTAETLDATDAAFNAYDAVLQNDSETEERMAPGGFGMLSSVPSGYRGTVTFRTFLEWDGTATMPSWATTFFPACGYVNSSGVFTPRTEFAGTNVKTLTIGLYRDGKLRRLTGCMGTFVVTLPAGKMGFIDWTFQGVWQGETDATILAPTYPTAKPIRFAGGTTEWNSVSLCVQQATFDAGNAVSLRECANNAAGFVSGFIGNRNPTITANPEALLVDDQDRWGAWTAQSEFEFSAVLSGPTTSTLEFAAPKAQLISSSEEDRNGIVSDNITWQANKNGTTLDQDLIITFTAAA